MRCQRTLAELGEVMPENPRVGGGNRGDRAKPACPVRVRAHLLLPARPIPILDQRARSQRGRRTWGRTDHAEKGQDHHGHGTKPEHACGSQSNHATIVNPPASSCIGDDPDAEGPSANTRPAEPGPRKGRLLVLRLGKADDLTVRVGCGRRVVVSVAATGVLVVFGAGGASAAKRVSLGGKARSSGASAVSSATVRWGRGVEAVLPANAGAKPNVFIESVSCPSAGNCSAVGQYIDSSGASEGLLLTEKAGRWRTGVEAPLPANAATTTNQFVRLNSVSCASPGNCSAVGAYKATDSSGFSEGLLLTEWGGKWETGVEAVPPASAGAPIAGASLASVSCASAGTCSAVGTSFDGAGNDQVLLFAEKAGVWGAIVPPLLPANAATAPRTEASLSAVSCASAGNCGAVGYYVDNSRTCQGLLLTETDGFWESGVEAQPANAIGCAVTFAVSCPRPGNCSANLGDYLLTQIAGWWGKGVKPALPANACTVGPGPGQCDGNYGGANSISCVSAGNCNAVGDYTDNSGIDQGLLLTKTASSWRAGVEAPRPAKAVGESLTSVSCASAGTCSAVGQYTDHSHAEGLLLKETAGKWTAGAAALPANAAGENQNRHVQLYAVSCASARNCSAVGDYIDRSGNYQGLLLDSHPLPPCVVPNLKGKTLAAARRSIRSHACSVGAIKHARSRRVKTGRVISQRPKPGKRLHLGARVNLVVSKGRR